jgi:hypothetical protein
MKKRYLIMQISKQDISAYARIFNRYLMDMGQDIFWICSDMFGYERISLGYVQIT